MAFDSWFRLRVVLWNVFLVQLPGYFYMLYFKVGGVPDLAQFILIASLLPENLIAFLTFFSETETSMISVERCDFFESIEPEPNYQSFELEKKKFLALPDKFDIQKVCSVVY